MKQDPTNDFNGVALPRLVRLTQFEREYLGIPEEPTATEKRLRELGDEYHAVTEAYDRIVCTGPIVRGAIRPNGAQELAIINRHALRVRERLWIEAEKLGASRADLQAAIRDAARRLPNAERIHGGDEAPNPNKTLPAVG